jgi:hypothetical protein
MNETICEIIDTNPDWNKICCYGGIDFLEDCPEVAKKFLWDEQFVKIACDNYGMIENMKILCPDKLPKDLPVNNDKPVCRNIFSVEKACCYGKDEFVKDCPYQSNLHPTFRREYLDKHCTDLPIQMKMNEICSDKVSVNLPINKDCKNCNNIKSINDAYCQGIDNYLKNCPYHALKNTYNKQNIELLGKLENCTNNSILNECDKSKIYIVIFIVVIFLILGSIFIFKNKRK